MTRIKDLKLLEDREGEGRAAQKGDRLVCNSRMYLNGGDEMPLNERQAAHVPKDLIRSERGVTYIEHRIVLGRPQVIGRIEQALMGMKVGGYGKVRISPHLAYRDKGLPALIPPDAVLVVELWLRENVA